MNLAIVYGTRPEAVKLGPVVSELCKCGVEPTIIQTGQHTSLLRGTPAETVLTPKVALGLTSSNDPVGYAEACTRALRDYWSSETSQPPDLVVVQGDTASAYAGAIAAHELGLPVAHIEAGIRTGDLKDPWPEEMFRVKIDGIACWQFCATEQNLEHVTSEPDFVNGEPAVVTGNPGIDALYAHTRPTTEVQDLVLITLHRRESFGEPLLRIVQGLWASAQRHPRIVFVWPTHPNPKVQEAAGAMPFAQNIALRVPMDTVPFAQMLATSRAVITDSGGVQEEAAALGIPCIVARDKTDRPESVELGLAKVVGRTAEGILTGLDWALGFTKRPEPSLCFGDGKAAPRIVGHLLG